MATIRVTCPTCRTQLEIDARHEGEEVECGSCLQVFVAESARPKIPARPTRDEPDDDAPPRRSRRRTRRDDYDDYDDEYARQPQGGGTAATFALLFGIAAILTACCPLTGIGFGIAAVAFGSAGAKNPSTKALAVTGSVLGSVGILLGVGMMIVWAVNG